MRSPAQPSAGRAYGSTENLSLMGPTSGPPLSERPAHYSNGTVIVSNYIEISYMLQERRKTTNHFKQTYHEASPFLTALANPAIVNKDYGGETGARLCNSVQ